MSYQVLYRAWRPDTFSEICGQDAVTRTLRRQVVSGHIAHAYLFCGTRGTGKTTASKVLARAINCLHPVDGDPCGECEICRMLKSETCMDVVEIDAASNNGVDEIRDLREKVKFPPAVTKYKVYIVDEVHMLSTGAFNALLKTLEEPPEHAVFILATTEPHRLPATILSRCQRFDFHRISVDVIVARLKVVLAGIGRTAEDDALAEIARAAEGAMRDALSLLDSCLSYTDGAVTLQLARDVLGTAGLSFMFEFADALVDFDAGRALTLIDDALNRGTDPQVFARDATEHMRGLLLASAVGDVAHMLEVTPEDAARFSEQASRMGGERAARLMDLFMRAEPDMKWASQPRVALELAAVRACHPERPEEDAALSERIARVEKLMESGARPAPKPAAKPAETPKPARPTTAAKPSPSAPAPEPPQEYLSAVEQLIATSNRKRVYEAMQFAGLQDGIVTVSFSKKNQMYKNLAERKPEEIAEAMTAAFGQPMTVRIVDEGIAAPKAEGTSSVAKRVIEQSYDIFGRENIDLES